MAELTQLPNGFYRVTDETGGQYDMPEDFARRQFPDKFGNDWSDAEAAKKSFEQYAAENYGGEPSEDPAMVDALAADLLDDSEMIMEPDVLGQPMMPVVGEDFAGDLGEPSLGADTQLEAPGPLGYQPAPQQGMPDGFSGSASVSAKYVNPFDLERSRGVTNAPDHSQAYSDIAEASAAQQESLRAQQVATGEYQETISGLGEEQQAERQYQAARAQEMHDNAMQAVAEQEARLAQRMQNMTKMDMNKIWKETPQGARVAGMFSAAIAGWLNPTGKNSVIEQMMQMVDQSAREQAANMELEKFQVQGQQQAIGRFEDRAARDRKAFLENRAIILAGIKDSMALEHDKYQSEITKQRIGAQIAEVDKALAETGIELRNEYFTQKLNRDKLIETKRQHNNQMMLEKNRMAMQAKIAAAKAKASAQGAGVGKGLFTLPDGRTVYANPNLDPNDTRINKVDQLVTVNRAVADASKRLYALALKGRRLSPNARGPVKTEIAAIIEDMRAIVGANLPKDEVKITIDSVGNPNDWITSPETVMSNINRGVRARRSRVDRALSQIGAHTVTAGQDGSLLSSRYKQGAGMMDEYFPGEFGEITIDKAVESDITSSLDETESARERYRMLVESEPGSSKTKDAERAYAEAAGSLLSQADAYGINEETMPELYARANELVADAPKGYAEEYLAREPGRIGDAGSLAKGASEALRNIGSEVESGVDLARIWEAEVAKYGFGGASRKAENGTGPLTEEQAEIAQKVLSK